MHGTRADSCDIARAASFGPPMAAPLVHLPHRPRADGTDRETMAGGGP